MKKLITILLLFLAIVGYGQADLNGRIPLRQIYPIDTTDTNINKPQWQAYIESLVPADSYISNVTESSNSIAFTGVSPAFNGSIGSIAKTDIAQSFAINSPGVYTLDIRNTSVSGGNGLSIYAGRDLADDIILNLGSAGFSTKHEFYSSGKVKFPNLTFGSATYALAIGLDGELVRETKPSTATDLTFSEESSPVTLNSSSGTDVTFTGGTNITLAGTSTDLTINSTNPLWTDGGTTTYLSSTSDKVSIGGTSTTHKLNVVGDLNVTDGAAISDNYALGTLSVVNNHATLGWGIQSSGFLADYYALGSGIFLMTNRSTAPAYSGNGLAAIWSSDGTGGAGNGDDGDVMMTIRNSSGTVKTITLIDFSAF